MNRHYRNAHQQENNIGKKYGLNVSIILYIFVSYRYDCVIDNCTKTFVNKQNLDRHIKISHKKLKSKPVKVSCTMNFYVMFILYSFSVFLL